MGQCLSAGDKKRGDLDPSFHGRHVARHFRQLKKLGVGSYGSVFLVERIEDGRQYAMKQTVLSELEEPLRWVAVNEIRLMASLDPHPNVVNCFEGFLDGDHLCIVMELVPGGELADIIQRHAEKDTFIPEGVIWSYFIQIALGVKYLHVHNILHRDLKPQNILVTQEGRLKLADLGVAHVVHGPKGTAKVQIGTPHYMAPEVWRRDPYSFPADIWALGCVLHEMCTRTPLFLADSQAAIESRVIAGVVPPISRRYSQDLRDTIASLLEYNPDDRPTIDDVLSSKAVRPRMLALMENSWNSMESVELSVQLSMQRAPSSVLDPIELPSDLKLLNLRLPKPRYSIGEGLVTVLATESNEYRNFGLGPADLPEIEMPWTQHQQQHKQQAAQQRRGPVPAARASPPGSKPSGALSIADTAYDSNGGGGNGTGGRSTSGALGASMLRMPTADAPANIAGGGSSGDLRTPFAAAAAAGGGDAAVGAVAEEQEPGTAGAVDAMPSPFAAAASLQRGSAEAMASAQL